jgi:hypothetical protein
MAWCLAKNRDNFTFYLYHSKLLKAILNRNMPEGLRLEMKERSQSLVHLQPALRKTFFLPVISNFYFANVQHSDPYKTLRMAVTYLVVCAFGVSLVVCGL